MFDDAPGLGPSCAEPRWGEACRLCALGGVPPRAARELRVTCGPPLRERRATSQAASQLAGQPASQPASQSFSVGCEGVCLAVEAYN